MIIKSYLFVGICCFSLLLSCNSVAQKTNLSVPEFEYAIGQDNIQLLDVRTPGESQSGHLKNALLADWNDKTEFQERVKSLDKNKPVYAYCLSGAGSNEAENRKKQCPPAPACILMNVNTVR